MSTETQAALARITDPALRARVAELIAEQADDMFWLLEAEKNEAGK